MSKTKEKVEQLIEDRLRKAVKEKVSQKLFLIAQVLGRPIISQTMFDSQYFDPYSNEDDLIYDGYDRIHDADEWSTTERGFYFDGLKMGINLTITAMIWDEKLSEMKATYNGYLVFAEVEGELKAYAPFPVWEDAMNMFYEASVERDKKIQAKKKEEQLAENRRRAEGFWKRFRMLWGY